MNPKTLLCVVLSMASLGQLATASDITSNWDGSTGNWSDSSRWDSLLFPNNGNGGLTYDALISGGTVTVDQAINIEELQLSNGSITGISDLTASGLTTWTGGEMTDTGVTNANGGLNLSGSTKFLTNGRTINNAGAATWTAGPITTSHGAVFNNQLGATFDTAFDGSFSNGAGGQSHFHNAGIFTKSGGTGTTTLGVEFNNTGIVEVDTGTLSLSGGGTSSGSFTGAAGTTLGLGGGHMLEASTSVSAPNVMFSGSGTNTISGTYSASATTTFSGATTTFNGTSAVPSAALVFTGGSAIFSNTGGANADTLDLSFGLLGGTAELTASGLTTWTGGEMTDTGVTNANGGLNLSGSTKFLTNGRTINNAGAATWTAGPIATGHGAVFNNQLRATFDTDFDGSFSNGAGGQSQFNNIGTLTKSSGTGVTNFSVEFNNSGTVEVDSGTLMLSQGGISTGGITAAAGTTLAFRGTHDFNTGSSVTSNGTVQFESGMWNLNDGTYNVTETTDITGGTAKFNAPATTNILNLSNGVLDGTAEVTASGLTSWTGGEMTDTGVTNANGGLNLSGSTKFLTYGRTINNAGAAAWTAGPITTSHGAVFNNQLGATFDTDFDGSFSNGAGGQSHFHNAGTFTKSGGTGVTNFSVTFNNTGTVNVNSGTLNFGETVYNAGSINVRPSMNLTLGSGLHNDEEGIVTVDNGHLSVASFVTNDGVLLVDSGGQFNLPSNQPFDNSGTLEVRDGTVVIGTTNSIVVHPLAPLEITPIATLSEGTWIARGTGAIQLPASAGGTPFDLRHNDAVVVLDGPNAEISVIDGLWTNSGTLELRGGHDLHLTGRPVQGLPNDPVSNSGTIRIGAGTTLSLGSQGMTSQSGSQVEGEGVIEGSVTAVGTMFSSSAALSINEGALTISTSTSTLAAGTLAVNVPMFVRNGGHFIIADGATLGGSGVLELQDGLVTIDGTLNKQVRVTGPVEIGGTISEATLDGAVVTSTAGAGFGLVNCFGENNIQSGVVNIDGQLLVNDGSTLVLGAGASVLGSGRMDVLGLGSVVINGNLASTGDATITGSLAVEAGATAQAANWHFTGNSLVSVKGKITSSTPVELTGTLAVDLAGEMDVPNIKMLGIPGFDPAKFKGSGKSVGDVAAGTFSTVSPGFSPGMLTIGGNMTFEGGSTLEFEVRDAQGTSGVDYDLLAVEGDLLNTATIAEPMTISLHTLDLLDAPGQASNFDNTQDYSWTIATVLGSISGFSARTYVIEESAFLNDLGNGAFYLSLGDSGHALNVLFSASGLPTIETGNFDLDGDVDGADFLIWQRNPAIGYLANWQANYGRSATQSAVSVAVPEPSSLLLLAIVPAWILSTLRLTKKSHFADRFLGNRGSACSSV
ncbi:beta strand repeat-containing protein [Bythopirellula goksoeyrii]|uniref:Autotransporter-associated beta strand repeat protein n=1 Tax=Bythopirellula goksoeyrii TaxID=1400387 RepID=A0A5B9QEB3_9BACT|nr:hypothetical protein [Bythopirellula goksoeyrii]QEG35935.1 hypothetical protein Pr1d_32430 [Bythopirellula goksoeyrii]